MQTTTGPPSTAQATLGEKTKLADASAILCFVICRGLITMGSLLAKREYRISVIQNIGWSFYTRSSWYARGFQLRTAVGNQRTLSKLVNVQLAPWLI